MKIFIFHYFTSFSIHPRKINKYEQTNAESHRRAQMTFFAANFPLTRWCLNTRLPSFLKSHLPLLLLLPCRSSSVTDYLPTIYGRRKRNASGEGTICSSLPFLVATFLLLYSPRTPVKKIVRVKRRFPQKVFAHSSMAQSEEYVYVFCQFSIHDTPWQNRKG